MVCTNIVFTLISDKKKSIHLENFINIPENFSNNKLNKKWIELKKIRDICNISIEEKRANKEIGSSLEANLVINLNEKLIQISEGIDFSELCITSKAKIVKVDQDEITVTTIKAEGKKCPVCWKISLEECKRHSK